MVSLRAMADLACTSCEFSRRVSGVPERIACHRHAPVASPLSTNSINLTPWPKLSADDRCGDYEADANRKRWTA
jgi:hypothetical protein